MCKDIDLQTFLEGEEYQNTKRKTESYVFLGFGNSISRSWERKSTTKRFATGRFWPCTWKISCILKIRPIVCFCSDSTHVFILSAPTHFTIFIRGLPILLISLIKSTFLISKGLLCFYDKQNNTWLLVGITFLFSCSLVSYRVTVNTRREIPYLRAVHVLFYI